MFGLRSFAALAFLSCALGAFDSCTDGGGDTADAIASHYNLTGKIAIVTGGDGGLGFAVAQSLAMQHATVVLASRNQNKTGAAAARIRAAGGDARAMELDLAHLISVRAFAAQFGALVMRQTAVGVHACGGHGHAFGMRWARRGPCFRTT